MTLVNNFRDLVRMKEAREGRDITDKDIAEEAKVSATTVWRAKKEIHRLNVKTLEKLCRWLGVQISDIVYIDYDGREAG